MSVESLIWYNWKKLFPCFFDTIQPKFQRIKPCSFAGRIRLSWIVFVSCSTVLYATIYSSICHSFCQVKVQTWVDGIEDREFVGVGARFGTTIVSKEKNANQTHLTLSDPRDGCSPPKEMVFFPPCIYILYTLVNHTLETFNFKLIPNISWPLNFFSMLEMSWWWNEGNANSQPRQMLHNLLVLQLSSL